MERRQQAEKQAAGKKQKMKHRRKCIVGYLIAVIVFLICSPVKKVYAAAADQYTLMVDGTRHYSKAYEMLDYVNELRGSLGLNALEMDTELMEAAMQRAAECAVDYSHTRPNGTSCATITSRLNGENIAAGISTAQGTFNAWKNSVGHYSNMVGINYKSIGIGCFQLGTSQWYWVQIFSVSSSAGFTKKSDADVTSSVRVLEGARPLEINLNQKVPEEGPAFMVGDTYDITVCRVNPGWSVNYSWFSAESFQWTSSDPSVAAVDAGGTVTGIALGDAVIRAVPKVFEGSSPEGMTVTVHVREAIDAAQIADIEEVTYDGTQQTPTPEVYLDGKKLESNIDFTYRYAANTNVGYGYVYIDGIGKYTGTIRKQFTIRRLDISNLVDISLTNWKMDGYETAKACVQENVTVTWKKDGSVLDSGQYSFYTSGTSQDGSVVSCFRVQFRGNYKGSKYLSYLGNGRVDEISEQVYAARSLEPEIHVYASASSSAAQMKPEDGFQVSYANNFNVGEADVLITGVNQYYGTLSASFTIIPRELSDVEFAETPAQIYTGDAHTPELSAYFGEKTLQQGLDYIVTGYENNTNAGSAEAIVEGTGNFTGTKRVAFMIDPQPIAKDAVSNMEDQIYTGEEFTPVPEVYAGTLLLTEGLDYIIKEYSGNRNAGTASVIVEGKGNYCGMAEGTFAIAPRTLSADMAAPIEDQAYTGEEIIPEVILNYNGMELVSGTDFSVTADHNTERGTALAVITGQGNFCGSMELEFNIIPRDIAGTEVEPLPDLTYDGAAKTPAPVVKDGEKTLEENVDYTVRYENNVNIGMADVILEGIENYQGTRILQFEILPIDISEAVMEPIEEQTFTGQEIEPVIFVRLNGELLTPGEDYELRYTDNVNAGEASVIAEGRGMYGGTSRSSFVIKPKPIPENAVSNIEDQVYTGKDLTPAAEVYDGTLALTQGIDFTVKEYSNNRNIGTAGVTVEGTGNYCGEAKRTFTIVPRALSMDMAAPIEDQWFTGEAIIPEAVLSFNGIELISGIDFTVTAENNTERGTALAIISGQGNFCDVITLEFSIVFKDISLLEVDEIAAVPYDGTEKFPVPVVRDGEKILEENADYTVYYQNNVNAGTAQVILEGIGYYQGTRSIPFDILPINISDAVMGSIEEQTYTGREIEPVTSVSLYEELLTPGEDYVLRYENNINAGEASIIAEGTGNYTGSVNRQFRILAKSIDGAMVSAISDQAYSGSEICPSVHITVDEIVLTEGSDYDVSYRDNVEIGTAKVTITGQGNFIGTIERYFSIVPGDISGKEVEQIASYTYDGTAKVPVPVVKNGGKTLEEKKDYIVRYQNNVNAGTADVILEGIGSYQGTRTVQFEILPMDISEAAITPIAAQEYTGSDLCPVPEVTVAETALTQETDYDVSYRDNVEAGTAKVVISGKGNFCGAVEQDFSIIPRDISEAEVEPIASFIYDGTEKQPAPIVRDGKILEEKKDFTVRYQDNIHAGTAGVILEGLGNYQGTRTVQFEILPMEISDAVISPIPDQEYTGSEICPSAWISVGEIVLNEGTDYDVSYSDNVEIGTAKAVITGQMDFDGTAELYFSIVPRDISGIQVEQIAALPYDGTAKVPAPVVKDGKKTLEDGEDYLISYQNNVNAGTADVILEGTGNYRGTRTVQFEILPIDISDAVVEPIEEQTYAGQEIEPVVSVRLHDEQLIPGEDYTLRYENNVNAGEAAIIAEGIGNYTGTLVTSFEIKPRQIAQDAVSEIEDQVYNGTELTPEPEVYDGTKLLFAGSDYTVKEYSSNVNAGTASVTVAGKGNYFGEVKRTFTILPRMISAEMVKTIKQGWVTGISAISGMILSYNNIELGIGKDYSVKVEANAESRSVQVIITGRGNFTGTAELNLAIGRKDISDMEVDPIASATYDGNTKLPKVAVRDGNKTLQVNKDYTVRYQNNINAGTANAVLQGIGNYQGSRTVQFKILPRNISAAVISPITAQEYTGSAVSPAVNVTLAGTTLIKGKDYNVAYRDNVKAGTAKVTITGKGNYTGVKDTSFTIKASSSSGQNPAVAADVGAGTAASAAENLLESMPGNKDDTTGMSFVLLQARYSKVKKSAITIKWQPVRGAARYRVLGSKCGQKYKYLGTTGGSTFTKKKLKKGTYYKFIVMAVDGNGKVISTSKSIHVATLGGKVGNDKKVTLNKKKITLKVKKKFTIKATTVPASSLKVKRHRKIAFESSNPSVATVNKNGVVRGVSKGTCYVYCYAQDGVYARAKITVK